MFAAFKIMMTAPDGGPPAVFEIAGTSRYESVSAATTHAITVPTGTAVGDLLIAMVQNDVSATRTPPTGWTAFASSGQGQAFWKIADSGDLGSLTWTHSASRTCGIVLLRVTGTHATDPIANITSGNADPSNLSSPWGSGDFIGVSFLGDLNNAATVGTVTPPSGTTLIESSPASGASTVGGVCYAASTTLTAVSAWNPATWTVSGTLSGTRRSYTILVRQP